MKKEEPLFWLRVLIPVYLVSLTLLALEILVSRVSSVVFTYHYSFLVVSLALLGLGGGGILVFYLDREKNVYHKLALYSSGFALSILFFVLSLTRFYLIKNLYTYFSILFLPFFFAGAVISLSFRRFPQYIGKIYSADLLGASSGALLSLGVLEVWGGVRGLLFLSILGSLSSILFIRFEKKKLFFLGAGILTLSTSLFLIDFSYPILGEVPLEKNPEKDLFNLLTEPVAPVQIVETRWSPFGRTDLVSYKEDRGVMFLFIDGAAGTPMFRFTGDPDNPGDVVEALREEFPEYIPLSLIKEKDKKSLLVIGPGGGKEILLGILEGFKKIVGVEINRDFVELVKKYRNYNGGIYTDFENVNIIVAEGRSFLKASPDTYDVLILSLPVTKSSRSLEGFSLTENYLFTVEAVKDYLNHLKPGGEVIIVLHRPYEILKFIILSLYAFQDMGKSIPEALSHIYTLGEKGNPVLVIKKTPLSREEKEKINRIKKSKTLQSTEKILTLLQKGELSLKELLRSYPLDISPVYDDRPFFYKFHRGIPRVLSIATFWGIIFNLLIMAFPFFKRRIILKDSRFLFIFSLLGWGFMSVEIPLFQKFILYLGSPSISLSILLTALLTGMGLGSRWGEKIIPGPPEKRFRIASLIISGMVLLLLFSHTRILEKIIQLNYPLKSLVSFFLLLPLGIFMGIPFPTALNILRKKGKTSLIPWMYGVNGGMSVLGAVLSTVIAILIGFRGVLLVGAFFYLLLGLTQK